MDNVNTLRYLILIGSVSGIGINLSYLGITDFLVLCIGCIPYILPLIFLKFRSLVYPILCGILFMLLVDSWLLVEDLLETKSQFLLGASILSTFKLIIVLPLGMFVGYIMCRGIKGTDSLKPRL